MLPENFHPHSRFVLKEQPWGYQAADIIHNTSDGPVFDLGVDLDDRNGIAFLRVSDVEEMSRVLGMATREEVEDYKAVIALLEAQVKYLPREVESLKDGLADLVSGFLTSITADSVLASVADPEEDEQGDSGFVDEDFDSSDSESGEVAGQDSDASVGEGSNELPSSSSDEFGFNFSA
jgi:hypothetical protein